MLIDYLNDHDFHRDEQWPARRAASISRLQVNRSVCVYFVSLHCQFSGSCSCYPGIHLACDMSRNTLRNSAMHCGKQNAVGDRSSACWGFFPNSIWHLDLSFCFFFWTLPILLFFDWILAKRVRSVRMAGSFEYSLEQYKCKKGLAKKQEA